MRDHMFDQHAPCLGRPTRLRNQAMSPEDPARVASWPLPCNPSSSRRASHSQQRHVTTFGFQWKPQASSLELDFYRPLNHGCTRGQCPESWLASIYLSPIASTVSVPGGVAIDSAMMSDCHEHAELFRAVSPRRFHSNKKVLQRVFHRDEGR